MVIFEYLRCLNILYELKEFCISFFHIFSYLVFFPQGLLYFPICVYRCVCQFTISCILEIYHWHTNLSLINRWFYFASIRFCIILPWFIVIYFSVPYCCNVYFHNVPDMCVWLFCSSSHLQLAFPSMSCHIFDKALHLYVEQ